MQFVILGTMVAINGRVIDGVKPENDVFFYNNNRNHFWKVLQYLLEPKKEARRGLTIKEKKAFLEKHGIAICNIVQKVDVPNKYRLDPSDTVLFEAHAKGRLELKKISPKVKKILIESPLYFTCRSKKGIKDLVQDFFVLNSIDQRISESIWYWPTPTRCNPKARAEVWKQEMQK